MFKYVVVSLFALLLSASVQAQQLKDLGLGGVLAVGYELDYEMPVVGFGFQFDGTGMTLELGMTEDRFAIGSDFDTPILRIRDYTYLSAGFGFRFIEEDRLARLNLGVLLGRFRLKISHGWVFTSGVEVDWQENRATMFGLQYFL